jgi:TRAP-type uncharacterized transport system fused permease subunit
MQSFTSKFNWRLIGIHFLAVFFLSLSLGEFLYFCDFELLEAMLDHSSKLAFNTILLEEGGSERLMRFMMITQSCPMIASLLGFIISLTICVRSKISWLNSLVVFLLVSTAFHLLFPEPINLDGRIQSLENWMNEFGLALRLTTFGILYLGISVLLFFKFGWPKETR